MKSHHDLLVLPRHISPSDRMLLRAPVRFVWPVREAILAMGQAAPESALGQEQVRILRGCFEVEDWMNITSESTCEQCDAHPVAVCELATDSPHHGSTICLRCAR